MHAIIPASHPTFHIKVILVRCSCWTFISVTVLQISRLLGRFHSEISVLTSCSSSSLIPLSVIVKKSLMRNWFLMLLSICLLVYSFLSIQTYTNNILLPFNWLHCIELITHLSVSSNSILISGAAIDLSSLIVVEGKVCWDLYIDGLVVSSDGNLLDALAAAIKVTFWLVLLVTCSFKFHIFLATVWMEPRISTLQMNW